MNIHKYITCRKQKNRTALQRYNDASSRTTVWQFLNIIIFLFSLVFCYSFCPFNCVLLLLLCALVVVTKNPKNPRIVSDLKKKGRGNKLSLHFSSLFLDKTMTHGWKFLKLKPVPTTSTWLLAFPAIERFLL